MRPCCKPRIRSRLAGGCVCCTLADGLPVAFERLLARRPPLDVILVEASGVADPRKIAGYARLAGLSDPRVVVVVDAVAIRALQSDRFVASGIDRQIRSAGLLVVNKRDAVDDASAIDVTERFTGSSRRRPVSSKPVMGSSIGTIFPGAATKAVGTAAAGDVAHDENAYVRGPGRAKARSRALHSNASRTRSRRGRCAPGGIVALPSASADVRYVWQWTPAESTLVPLGEWGNGRPQSSIVVVGRARDEIASFCDGLARTLLLRDRS